MDLRISILNILLPMLIMGVVFVNGFTDAPNAIATAVGTRSLRPRTAVVLCAVLNFFGVLVMSLFSRKVADTITGMISFAGSREHAIASLAAAMFSIVAWAVLAWAFSIPTSESHALIAGLIGAAVSLNGFRSGVNFSNLVTVIWGLVLSMGAGFVLGYLVNYCIRKLYRHARRQRMAKGFRFGQIVTAAAMSFLHGAQDGQKFVGVYVIATQISRGIYEGGAVNIGDHIGVLLLCSIVMGMGTSFGGGRIIKSVGMDMVRMEVDEGFAADLSSSISLLLLSIFGYPVSTTQVKTTAIMGVGASKGKKYVNWKIVREMVLAWGLTFPACFLLSYAMTKLFLAVFI